MTAPIPTPKTETFRVLLADPGWKFGDSLPGKKRGAVKHYTCMQLDEIARFPLPPLAKDATLILWRVASMVEEALFVARAWGFKPKAELVWVKTKVGEDGRHKGLRIGMGRQVRNAHEVAIIATRGKGAPRLSKSEPSVVFAPRGEHSAKPAVAYELIERLYEGPRVELFARRERPGWRCFGNELAEAHP